MANLTTLEAGRILGEVKARPKDIISFSLDYLSKSKVQTSNPSSSPKPLDTPARPADFLVFIVFAFLCCFSVDMFLRFFIFHRTKNGGFWNKHMQAHGALLLNIPNTCTNIL